jgi:hypothetical protein
MTDQNQGRRRIDRILAPGYGQDIGALDLEDVRARRDECLAEREYLSYLRRLLHGRLEILGPKCRPARTAPRYRS